MNINDIIDFENENTNLDFKAVEYNKDNYVSLLKDVMSMANSISTDTKYIIGGVKNRPGEDNEILGLDDVSDQAIFENVIQENIEPTINFKYYAYFYNNAKLGIFEITANNDRPYMMKKDYNSLKKGEMWIRKGSRNSRVTRSDLDKMLFEKTSMRFNNKVKIGFGESLETCISLKKSVLDYDNLPSAKEKRDLEEYKRRLKMLNEQHEERENHPELYPGYSTLSKLASIGQIVEYNSSKKGIKIGYDQIGMPVYCNEQELEKRIKTVKEDYYDYDCYYKYEENSYKINFSIYNDGNEFLEDVQIELYFDPDVFEIPTKKYKKPKSGISSAVEAVYSEPAFLSYPSVKNKDTYIVVSDSHNQIRHKAYTKVLKDDLRILVNANTTKNESNIKYIISARNLPNHIEGTLTVKIEA